MQRRPSEPGLLDTVHAGGREFTVGRARMADVPALVALLADDPLGAGRETGDVRVYEAAFRLIDGDPNQFLAAVRDREGVVVGTMQLTLIPGLSRGAATRLQLEAVRVAAPARGVGLGAAMFQWAHSYGRSRGAALAQLTTDKARLDAHRFYERLGYKATHEGLKLELWHSPEAEDRRAALPLSAVERLEVTDAAHASSFNRRHGHHMSR